MGQLPGRWVGVPAASTGWEGRACEGDGSGPDGHATMVGRTLSHYHVVDKLGSGGMGVVYLAEDRRLQRHVALKMLPPEVAGNAKRLARFQREARVVASLNHPNIVTLHSVEQVEDVHFLVMEYVEGRTLYEALPPNGLNRSAFFPIAIALADALSVAHEAGIVHRDLKPGNIMVTNRGDPKILDFGLAKLRPRPGAPFSSELETEPLTGARQVIGTLSYMSPEQVQGGTADHRSDIFSLGIVLYEMATGRRPFQGDSGAELVSSILRDTPSPADDIRTELPHHLGRIIRHCLEKSPERRLQSAKDLRNELEDLERELSSTEVTTSGSASSANTVGRAGFWRASRAIKAVGLALVVGFAALTSWQLVSRKGEPPPISPAAQRLLDQGQLSEMRGLTRENLEDAVERYRGALQLEPESAHVRARLASVLSLMQIQYPEPERVEEIDRLTSAALEQSPELALAHIASGRVALLEGDRQAAERAARRALDADPTEHQGHSLLGQVMIRDARVEPGLEHLRRAVSVAGSDVRAMMVLAYELKHLGRGDEAAAEYQKVLAYDPDHRGALNDLAVIYVETGRDLDAIPHFRRLLQLGEDEAAAQNLGVAYFNIGEMEQAIEAFRTSHRIDPAKPLAPHGLGDAHERLGDVDSAERWYGTAVANYDGALEAGGQRSFLLPLRAVCLAKLGRFDEARNDVAEALALEPDSGWRLFYAAQVYALAGLVDEAYEHAARAIEAGYARAQFLREPAFASYRDDPSFLAVLEITED